MNYAPEYRFEEMVSQHIHSPRDVKQVSRPSSLVDEIISRAHA